MTAFIDTHAHYFDKRFSELEGGADALLASPEFRSVTRAVINIGTNPENSRTAVAQAARYPFMVAAVGIHPEDAQGLNGEEPPKPLDLSACMEDLRSWISDPAARRRDKIVAIGEIGLDYHWEPMDKELQARFFDAQLTLAGELDLPVIIHDREAHGACFDMVVKHPRVRGVFHGYSGSAETARELIRRGWYVAFGGSSTFKNAERVRAVAASVPLDHMLLETDCPYMAPVPFRGRINHSGLIPCIAEVIAGLHGVDVAELAEITSRNADDLFHLREHIPDLFGI